MPEWVKLAIARSKKKRGVVYRSGLIIERVNLKRRKHIGIRVLNIGKSRLYLIKEFFFLVVP
jgi:hypothetical protein